MVWSLSRPLPRASVLPPGVGDKADKPEEEFDDPIDHGYADDATGNGQGHAPAIARHDDGDVASVLSGGVAHSVTAPGAFAHHGLADRGPGSIADEHGPATTRTFIRDWYASAP